MKEFYFIYDTVENEAIIVDCESKEEAITKAQKFAEDESIELADLQVFKACFMEAVPAPEKPKDITEEVKSYEDACRVLGYNVTEDSVLRREGFRPDEIARRKLEIITEALNEGWAPDWNNTNEYKYYPWFYIQPYGGADKAAGLTYASTYYAASYSSANIGSRLCYKTRNLAAYAGEQFKELYKIMLLK